MNSPLEQVAEALRLQVPLVGLVPLLRKALSFLFMQVSRCSCSRLLGELFGLLLMSDKAGSLNVKLLLAGLVRELCVDGKLPSFVPESISAYSEAKLQVVLPLIRQLGDKHFSTEANVDFLIALIRSNEQAGVGVKLEALSLLVERSFGGKKLESLDDFVADAISGCSADIEEKRSGSSSFGSLMRRSKKVSSFALEIDGTKAYDIFTVLVHSPVFTPDQLLHVGVFSCLHAFLDLRLGRRIKVEEEEGDELVGPPNSPAGDGSPLPDRLLLSASSSSSSRLAEAVVSLAIRVFEQSQREISPIIFNGKISWKFFPPSESLLSYTREMVESAIVQVLKCLDVVSRKDPSVVSLVFPHLRRMFERVMILRRSESCGVALCEILKYFINHSYLVIFDLEPVLSHFFSVHIPSLVPGSPVVAMEAVVFLVEYASILSQFQSHIFSKFFPSVLRLAAWFPRTAGSELVALIPSWVRAGAPIVDLLNTILDLPLITAVSELSACAQDYYPLDEPGSVDLVAARAAMKLYRSKEFREVQKYCSRSCGNFFCTGLAKFFWNGLPVTPRVAASSTLVPAYVSSLLAEMNGVEKASEVFPAILSRYGAANVFLFDSKSNQLGTLFIAYLDREVNEQLLYAHKSQVVSAIVDRVEQGTCVELVTHLVSKIGNEIKSRPVPLFFKILKWLLAGGDASLILPPPALQVVYTKQGHVVQAPDDHHEALDILMSKNFRFEIPNQLSCVVISALTKLAVSFPQYRPQIVYLFEHLPQSPAVLHERIAESLILLLSFNLSRDLMHTGPFGG